MKLGMEEEEIISSASQAATSAIHRLTMEDKLASSFSCSYSSTVSLGGRAIDRCNPIIRDAARIGKVVQLTTNPKHHNENSRGNMTNIPQTKKKKTTSSLRKGNKSSSNADCADKMVTKTGSISKPATGNYEINVNSPGDSSRYLLTTSNTNTEIKSFVYSHRFDPLVEQQSPSTSSFSFSQPTSSPASAASNNQVVVLQVSLHCKGCERKMRKHISKMEGVTSFNIDFAAKKLTVVGDVTPQSVLASVSKVKKAQLLTPPPLMSSTILSSSCSYNSISQIGKDKALLV